MTDGSYAHGDIRQLFADDKRISDELIKTLKMQLQLVEQDNAYLKSRLQQAERVRDDYYNNYLRILADTDTKELQNHISMQAELISQLQQDKDVLEARLLAAQALNYQTEAESLGNMVAVMREALEEVYFQIGFIEYNDTQPIKDVISAVLSRYPKEGGEPDAAPTV